MHLFSRIILSMLNPLNLRSFDFESTLDSAKDHWAVIQPSNPTGPAHLHSQKKGDQNLRISYFRFLQFEFKLFLLWAYLKIQILNESIHSDLKVKMKNQLTPCSSEE